ARRSPRTCLIVMTPLRPSSASPRRPAPLCTGQLDRSLNGTGHDGSDVHGAPRGPPPRGRLQLASGLQPAENPFELGPDLFPWSIEVESPSPEAVALDPDIEVGLSRRAGARVEEETADRPRMVGIGVLHVRQHLIEMRRMDGLL